MRCSNQPRTNWRRTDIFWGERSMDSMIKRITFVYVPEKEETGAALNFHLTAREKREVMRSFTNSYNQEMLKQLLEIMK